MASRVFHRSAMMERTSKFHRLMAEAVEEYESMKASFDRLAGADQAKLDGTDRAEARTPLQTSSSTRNTSTGTVDLGTGAPLLSPVAPPVDAAARQLLPIAHPEGSGPFAASPQRTQPSRRLEEVEIDGQRGEAAMSADRSGLSGQAAVLKRGRPLEAVIRARKPDFSEAQQVDLPEEFNAVDAWGHCAHRLLERSSSRFYSLRACWDSALSGDADLFANRDFMDLCSHAHGTGGRRTGRNSLPTRADSSLSLQSTPQTNRRTAKRRGDGSTLARDDWKQRRWERFAGFVSRVNWACMAHPDSMRRVAWAVLGILFLGVDIYFMTMTTFGVRSPTQFELASLIYWSVDLVLTFRLGIYRDYKVDMNPWKAAIAYVRGWFFFDLALVALQIVMISLDKQSAYDSAEKVGILRWIRFLRFTKVVRLLKLESLFTLISQRLQSLYALLLLRIGCYMFLLVCYVHASAAFWHAIGHATSNGWVTAYDEIFLKFPMSYVGSLHWAVTQMQGSAEIMPGNGLERAVSTGHYVLSIIAVAVFISKVTTAMQAIQDVEVERYKLVKSAYSYMKDHNIPVELFIAVQRFLKDRGLNSNISHDNPHVNELLSVLPSSLRRGLLQEARWPVMSHSLAMRAFHRCCVPFSEKLLSELLHHAVFTDSEVVFQQGVMCDHMYFVSSGKGSYYNWSPMFMRVKNSLQMLENGEAWEEHRKLKAQLIQRVGTTMCEGGLWARWAYRGDFEASNEGHLGLLVLGVQPFENLVLNFVQLQASMREHAARVLSALAATPNCTDLFSSESVMGLIRERGSIAADDGAEGRIVSQSTRLTTPNPEEGVVEQVGALTFRHVA